ncbi:MAG: helix-turn-helix transcriptional regulator [Clostridia bacterium]|nr:helix-turn-helix transcriptional regulator [Clostridia bacterium]
MYDRFVRERITQLRIQKGVSEYQMSYDLGHSRGYVYNISSGNALPPMKEFFAICDYFNITPKQFFDVSVDYPVEVQNIIDEIKDFKEPDLKFIMELVKRIKSNK